MRSRGPNDGRGNSPGRSRAVRQGTLVGLIAASLAAAGLAACSRGGSFHDPGLAVAIGVAARGPATAPNPSGAANRYNTGAPHSPVVERMLAAQTPAPFAAGKLPAGWTQGIDVSSLNHPDGAPIGWTKVAAAGHRFAFVKATEGSYYANPYYTSDVAAARKVGVFTAAYHFAIPNDSSAILQADLAVNAAGNLTTDGATLPLILDAEYDPYVSLDHTNYCYGLSQPAMVAWIQAFTAEVMRRTGEAPAIYTTADWWSLCTGNSTAFSADALWQASNGTPPAVPGWTGWTYWQHTSGAAVPGISGKTDADYFKATTLSGATPRGRTDPIGANISLPIRSLAATAGNAITYAASGLPPGLSIDPATGVISGTLPATPASYPATVTLTGPASQAQVLPITWNVRGPARLIRRPRQSSSAGGATSLWLTATDGLPGCTLAFTATGLPPGLTISRCGQIGGWAWRPGSYQPVVRAGDSAKPDLTSVTLSWKVAASPAATTGQVRLALNDAGKCLADRPGASGPAAQIEPCGQTPGQRWTIASDGTISHAGACLAALTLPGGKITAALRSCDNRLAQIWQQTWFGGLASAQTGLCLTDPNASLANGTAAVLDGCAGTQRQAWTLPPGPLSAGIPGKCLAETPASGGNPAVVALARCSSGATASAGQRWVITPGGAITTGAVCLDTGQSPAPGTPVTLAACASGQPTQHWRPLASLSTSAATIASATGTSGTFLVNPATGLCLAAPTTASTSPLALSYCVTGFPRLTWHAS